MLGEQIALRSDGFGNAIVQVGVTPMRWLHDPLYRVLGPARGGVRPVEQRALAFIEHRPGVTVAELRDALVVGSARIWQVVERLEWLGAVHRDGPPPRRLGTRRSAVPTIRRLLGADAPAGSLCSPDGFDRH